MKNFIKPWMHKCNPELILRFWRHKGSPGYLTMEKYGVYISYVNTPFGELALLGDLVQKDYKDK